MSPATVEQRVATFLRDHRRDGAHCDACIAKALRLGAGQNRTMTRNVTLGFVQTGQFRRGHETCCRCGEQRLVVHCVEVSASQRVLAAGFFVFTVRTEVRRWAAEELFG
jgi:hypothetical protein